MADRVEYCFPDFLPITLTFDHATAGEAVSEGVLQIRALSSERR